MTKFVRPSASQNRLIIPDSEIEYLNEERQRAIKDIQEQWPESFNSLSQAEKAPHRNTYSTVWHRYFGPTKDGEDRNWQQIVDDYGSIKAYLDERRQRAREEYREQATPDQDDGGENGENEGEGEDATQDGAVATGGAMSVSPGAMSGDLDEHELRVAREAFKLGMLIQNDEQADLARLQMSIGRGYGDECDDGNRN